MGCKSPIQATKNEAGSIRILPRFVSGQSLASRQALGDRVIELPCGRCAQCREAKAREWSIRCGHEAQLHRHQDGSPNGCFITLTFENEGLLFRELQWGTHPSSLDVKDWQRFAKRLRKSGANFKYFAVGEYGDQNKRPHYHALLFGEDFSQDRIQCKDQSGNDCYQSPRLEKLWGYGKTDIRPITPETTNYVCRYVTKKLNGPKLAQSLERLDSETGEIVTVRPEFAVMSRGGRTGKGLASGWYEKFKTDVFPDDFVIVKGKPRPVPRYYRKLLKEQDEGLYQTVQLRAQTNATRYLQDQTPERRAVREKIAIARQKAGGKRKLD